MAEKLSAQTRGMGKLERMQESKWEGKNPRRQIQIFSVADGKWINNVAGILSRLHFNLV